VQNKIQRNSNSGNLAPAWRFGHTSDGNVVFLRWEHIIKINCLQIIIKNILPKVCTCYRNYPQSERTG